MGSLFSKRAKPQQPAQQPAQAPAKQPQVAPAAAAAGAPAAGGGEGKMRDDGKEGVAEIECKGEFVSHVVGKGGATIKEIRAKAPGAQIDLPQNIKPRDMGVIVVRGPPDAVRVASNEIAQIIAARKRDLEESDALHSEAYAEVEEAAKLREKYFAESKAAFERGDKALAKELSDKGKAEGARMEQAKLRAAKKIAAAKNEGRPVNEIDLHGLQVDGALLLLEERLAELNARHKDLKTFTVIPGAGIHSDGAGPKLKPAVAKWLNEKGLKFEETGNGVFTVSIN
jgi:DNA-nicking Smr family endonuclease